MLCIEDGWRGDACGGLRENEAMTNQGWGRRTVQGPHDSNGCLLRLSL